jgi:hypothetical protein
VPNPSHTCTHIHRAAAAAAAAAADSGVVRSLTANVTSVALR